MTAYRTGYGTGLYGIKAYGLDGSTFSGAMLVSAGATVVANGQRKRTASSAVLCDLSVSAAPRVVRAASAVVVINATLRPNGRRKWEPEPDTPETWKAISPASGIWSDVSSASEIWTEVA